MITPTFLRFVVKPIASQGNVGWLSGGHSYLPLESGLFLFHTSIKTQSQILQIVSLVENVQAEDFWKKSSLKNGKKFAAAEQLLRRCECLPRWQRDNHSTVVDCSRTKLKFTPSVCLLCQKKKGGGLDIIEYQGWLVKDETLRKKASKDL